MSLFNDEITQAIHAIDIAEAAILRAIRVSDTMWNRQHAQEARDALLDAQEHLDTATKSEQQCEQELKDWLSKHPKQ